MSTTFPTQPLKFYYYIKQRKSGQSNIPVLKTNDKLVSEPAEVAETLNPKYISQFMREPTGDLPNIDGQFVTSMSDIVFHHARNRKASK